MYAVLAFFPIMAAALYGLGFALTGRAMETINVATYITIGSIFGVFMAGFLWTLRGEPVSFAFLSEKPLTLLIIFGACIAPGLGWLLTLYAIKNISPAYAVFAEISYPLFTLLFLFLLFGVRHFGAHVLIGGGLIMLGSFIMVLGQIKSGAG